MHQRVVHDGKPIQKDDASAKGVMPSEFVCLICKKGFDTEKALLQHRGSVHEKKATEKDGSATEGGKEAVKPPCKYWAMGSCKNGDACRFSHEKKATKTDGSAATGAKEAVNAPCKYWAMGSCKNGDACRFSHDSQAAKNDRSAAKGGKGPVKPPPPAGKGRTGSGRGSVGKGSAGRSGGSVRQSAKQGVQDAGFLSDSSD